MKQATPTWKHDRRLGMVCYFDPDTYPGVVNSCNILAEQGWEVDVVCLDQYGFGGAVFNEQVKLHRLQHSEGGSLSNFQRFITFINQVRRRGTEWDFAIGHDMYGFVAARMSRAVPADRVIFWSQDLAEPSRLPVSKRLLYRLKRQFIKTCPLALAPSQERAQCLQNTLPIRTTPAVVYNSPRLEVSCAKGNGWHRQLGINQNDIVGIYAGGFGRNRYVPELVQSVKYWPNYVHLIIAGYGHAEVIQTLKQLMAAPVMRGRVHLLEHRPSVFDLLSEADFGVSLFQHDPGHRNLLHRGLASNKTFEYLAFGCPVIVSENNETRAFVDRFDCGSCVDDATPQLIADAVQEMIAEPRRFRQMGANASAAHRDETHFEKRWAPVQKLLERGVLVEDPAN